MKKLLALSLVLIMAVACFAGCAKTEKAAPVTLRINLASEPDYLDPAKNSSVDGATLAANSFGGLYTYDNTGALAPNFASGYTVSEDGLTYTFTLRDGLKWSDGSDLTASDFVYSWKRAANPITAADYAYMLNVIAGYGEARTENEAGEVQDVNAVDMDKLQVSAPDAKTVVVTLATPCAYFLDLVAFPTYYPVKQSEVEKPEDWQTNPAAWCSDAGFISCGAYVLESWSHDENMVYVKNPYWYDAANVKIDRLEFMLSADDTAIFAAYNAGNLDFIDTVPTDEIKNLKENPEFYIIPNLGTYYVVFNVNSPMYEGKTVEQAAAVRKAFGKLVDRQYIIDTVAQCEQEIATTFIPAGMADGNGGVFKADDFGYYETAVDVDGAIALLESAGYKFTDGKLDASTPIDFEYLTNESSAHVAIAECIQQDLGKIGITMTIRSIDWATFLDERKAGNFGIARNGWLADFNDPINMLEMWETNSGNNDVQFGREQDTHPAAPDWTEYNALIREIKSTTDFAKRVELMHQAEDDLMETGALMPIYYYNDLFMMKSNISGFYASLFGTKYFMYCNVGEAAK